MRSQSIRQQAMSVSGASREQERAMSKDQMRGKSPDGMTQNSEGLKRRDLLLNGSSLLAASALSGVGFATPAQAQQPPATSPAGQPPNIVFIMGDDICWFKQRPHQPGLKRNRHAEPVKPLHQ